MISQAKDLWKFWNELKNNNARITLIDIDKLEKLLGNAFQKINDLEVSRDKWKTRALKK
jgi:hypothetical protein